MNAFPENLRKFEYSTICFVLLKIACFYTYVAMQVRNQGELGHFPPPENFKTLHSNFHICRNFQGIKMKFCILNIFKKSLI